MEEIENAFEELGQDEVLLCPNCYLVLWLDSDGMHYGQGSPIGHGRPIEKT